MEWHTIGSSLPRAIHLATLLLLFGGLVFESVVAPVARRLTMVWAGLALLSGAAWMIAVAGSMASAGNVWIAVAALPTVASLTSFGHVLCLRLLLLAAVLPLWRWSSAAALLTAGAAVALQPFLGHP